jgi:ubiquinone/menaquinone biosynthesis C-methylase UbiE
MTAQIDPEGTEAKFLLRLADLAAPGRKRVLEVGCGDGRLTWRYAEGTGQVIGIDLHLDDLRVAMIDRPANLADIVRLALADAVRLPFAKASFDLAIFAWSF